MQISSDKLKLASVEASDVFGDLVEIDGDASLHAFLRAVTYDRHGSLDDEIGRHTSSLVKKSIRNDIDILGYMSSAEYGVAIFESRQSEQGATGPIVFDHELPSGWSATSGMLTTLDNYLSQFARTILFVNEESKSVVALVRMRANHRWTQAFMSCFHGIMTWYFPKPIADEWKAFSRSIAYDTKSNTEEEKANAMIEYCNRIAAGLDFADRRLVKLLNGIGDRIKTEKINSLQSTYESVSRDIESYRCSLDSLFDKLEETSTELRAMRLLPTSGDEEIINFFRTHSNISLASVYDSNIRYVVDDMLEFYDPDEFVRYEETDGSVFHSTTQEMKRVLHKIFADRVGAFRTVAVFELRNMKLVRPLKYAAADDQYNSRANYALPNPHIYFYACSGQNDQYYDQFAERGEWDMGIEQSISATKNLNMGDTSVTRRLIEYISEHKDVPFIYYNGGEVVEEITEDVRLVSYNEFAKLTAEKKPRTRKKKEIENE